MGLAGLGCGAVLASFGERASASFSGLNQRVPLTVVKSSKSVALQMRLSRGRWLPGQIHRALIFTAVVNSTQPLPAKATGQTALTSKEDLGSPLFVVPRMNFGKTRTLPGTSESFSCACAGTASPIAR